MKNFFKTKYRIVEITTFSGRNVFKIQNKEWYNFYWHELDFQGIHLTFESAESYLLHWNYIPLIKVIKEY